MRLDRACLPADIEEGSFAARIMTAEGPIIVGLLRGAAFDMTPAFGTMSRWMEEEHPAAVIRTRGAPLALDLAALLANSAHDARDAAKPWLLAPVDLQAVKAAGVTYVRSMLERVIEERCRGDASLAAAVRIEVRGIIGDDLANLVPGSAEAARVKEALVAKGWWSQYLEVGIGPDAEIFTKCPPMAAVGIGAKIGVHPKSQWSNPEPECVLVVNSRGRIQGATLGNDVNLRDVEGRSALLLGRAKDNNASAALGPMIRLFDDGFSLEDIRRAEITLTISGRDGFALEETGAVGSISRDPTDLVAQMIGAHHQYPDGAVLYLGTPFSPAKDRAAPGMGFTHREGDIVRIASPRLGALVNEVDRTDECPPWTFGTGALFASLARRGLPRPC
ncbi:fumarylacetoacetate hydrolase family protein [Roseomonas alkaliterrae]|uniref:Fumarylacetoacetate (FAA) hydrolase family protein n=1 Tax=Neoroseomonas alkaliterrae TaxID=1452450 RepID=A0A840Y4X4_9PROT|nr:fumarylacetoacetate hydrolase family protein [Neoroseomonas alkaliterrae]MBB5688944.1 fumarylacetoacetate (FAA) hydrolase family protein [Neoroseomonas alkaliterrae]MBR0678512.1 fumarylacetoacetate hydrolase family protein [Neoroseomonas alkaliterrae]